MREDRTVETSLIAKIYLALVAIAIVLVFVCAFFTRGIDTYTGSFDNVYDIEPTSVQEMNGTYIYTFDFRKFYMEDFDCIEFFSAHMFVEATRNGETIYTFDHDGGFWSSSPGVSYHFICVEDSSDVIQITVTPAYDVIDAGHLSFVVGNGLYLHKQIIRSSLPKFLASLMILIFSLALFIYYAYMKTKQPVTKDLHYLAIFSLLLGVWSINETDIVVLLLQTKIVSSLISYMSLMLMVPAFVLFFYNYLGMGDKFAHRILVAISSLEFVIFTVLHFTKILEFKETLKIVQATLVIGVSYMIISVIYKVIKRQWSRRLYVCLAGVVCAGIAVYIDVYFYAQGVAYGDADTYGRFVYLIFVVIMGWDLMTGTSEIIAKGKRAKQLEIFAITDSMTGMFNRNAYDIAIEKMESYENAAIIMADLNDLKYTNDNYGHESGDKYIIEFTEIFTDILDKVGNCYRIGGDEFCCIIEDARKINLEHLITPIRSRMNALSIKHTYAFKLEAALGYAKYNNEIDKDFKETIKRADSNMYINKREQKKIFEDDIFAED